ncbi:GSCFA domain-containing protein [Microbaculum marinum]|uniref:GSCFA domain-containing protein n=1 Tax=Microbaculum marinum TaxID=1764581 RepID=A0AAW9RYD7_9HYPH
MKPSPEQDRLIPFGRVVDPSRDISIAAHRDATDRMRPICRPEVRPKFQIDARKSVFVIGSCFARAIEARLRDMGGLVPEFDFRMTAHEWPSLPSNLINKFTPASIHSEISWCHRIYVRGDGFQPADAEELLYDVGNGEVVDGGLMGLRPLSRERAIERRSALYDYFRNIFEAEAVVITLGLVECWWDSERRRFIEEVPLATPLRSHYAGRIHFYRLDYDRCRALLQETIRLVDSVHHPKKFLITTSPVPLARTFTDDDIIVANTYGKSLLRTVSGELAERAPNVDYFPSYESVVLTRDWSVYQDDLRHVSPSAAARVIAQVMERYFVNVSAAQRDLIASISAFHDDDVGTAIELAERSLAAEPASLSGWYHLAQCRQRAGASVKAVEAWERVCALAPDNVLAVHSLAVAHIAAGSPQAGAEVAEAYLSRHPHTPYAELALAMAYLAAQRFADCLAVTERLASARAATDVCHTVASQAHEALGDIGAALESARLAAKFRWQSDELKDRVADLERRLAGAVADGAPATAPVL